MSTILGLVDVYTVIYVIYRTYNNGGQAPARYAATVVLVLLFAFIGIIAGLVGKADEEKFYLFAYLGIFLNIVAIIIISGILYAGAYI